MSQPAIMTEEIHQSDLMNARYDVHPSLSRARCGIYYRNFFCPSVYHILAFLHLIVLAKILKWAPNIDMYY